MNFCATGLPYWTLDIGGFFVKKGKPWFWNGEYENTSDDENYKELFTRWFQFAAFLPVFRSHGTDVRRELWNFGEEGTIYYDAMKSALELRYSLMPYIYSMVEKVREEDSTMLRMLAFDYREDNEALDITDQFMFGESIMVCPILNKGQTKRSVYLPKGNPWYNFTTGEEYADGQWIEVPVTMQEIPLFTRVRT